MANKYGGADDLTGEIAFIEQLAQCLGVLQLKFSQVDERQPVGDKDITAAEFDVLHRSVERACRLLAIRREELTEERKSV